MAKAEDLIVISKEDFEILITAFEEFTLGRNEEIKTAELKPFLEEAWVDGNTSGIWINDKQEDLKQDFLNKEIELT